MSLRIILACLILVGAPDSFAGDLSIQKFPISGHGSLSLPIPDAWKVDAKESHGQPMTLHISPRSGDAFNILVTPGWPAMGSKMLRRKVSAEVTKTSLQPEEKRFTIHDLGSSTVRGYYYAATDPAPAIGAYRYRTQGIASVGSLSLAFTILTNAGQENVVEAALAMLRAAGQVTSGPT